MTLPTPRLKTTGAHRGIKKQGPARRAKDERHQRLGGGERRQLRVVRQAAALATDAASYAQRHSARRECAAHQAEGEGGEEGGGGELRRVDRRGDAREGGLWAGGRMAGLP
uniref:Uncharacterized protein n=1 Tax=Emiliania huxleyi TaxID=2903 RepID=A0A7S3WCL5_EMIHU